MQKICTLTNIGGTMERERSGKIPWIVVLLLVTALCALSYLAAYLVHRAGGGSFGSYRAVGGSADMQLQVAGDGFVYYDGSTLTQVNSRGDTDWSYRIGGGVTFEATSSGVAAWNGSMLTLIDGQSGTTTYSGEQDTAVTSAKLGAKYAAVLLEGDSNRVLVMESGGREVYTVDAGQLTVVDYGFYSSGSLLWVMALDTTGSTPTCAIYTYKPRSMSIIGKISDTEQLMYAVTFQTDRICTAGVTYYKVYDYNAREIESQRKLVYGWYLISADEGDDPLQAFVPTGQSDGTDNLRDVRMLRNGVDRTVHMPYACRSIVARGDWVYGFSPEGYVMQASPARQKVDAYKMDFYIDRVYGVTESGVAVVSSGSTIYLITLGE